jgi:hypothetical protein
MSELDPYLGIPLEVVSFASRGDFSTAAVAASYRLQHQLPLLAAANGVEDASLLPHAFVRRAEDHAYQQLTQQHIFAPGTYDPLIVRDVFDLAGMVVAEHPFDLGNDSLIDRELPSAVDEFRRRHYG